jgi:hypothetical protein
MSLIVDLLQEIRPRPGIYIGNNSVKELAAFLRGFSYAAQKFGIADNDRFLEDFQEWIAGRFKVEIPRGWEDIILFYSVDESEAMQRFWELLDEYLAVSKTADC